MVLLRLFLFITVSSGFLDYITFKIGLFTSICSLWNSQMA